MMTGIVQRRSYQRGRIHVVSCSPDAPYSDSRGSNETGIEVYCRGLARLHRNDFAKPVEDSSRESSARNLYHVVYISRAGVLGGDRAGEGRWQTDGKSGEVLE